MSVVAIVLAGGASSRFGADKLAAVLDGEPVLHHAIRAAAAVADDLVLVVAPDAPAPALPPELAPRITVARDAEAQGGPLVAVAAVLETFPADDDSPRIALVVGGDMPNLVPAVLRLLIERLVADPALVAMTLGASQPAPLPMALRPAGARDAMDACLAGGRRSLRALLEAVPSAQLEEAAWRAIDPAGATLRDIDLPGDLRRH